MKLVQNSESSKAEAYPPVESWLPPAESDLIPPAAVNHFQMALETPFVDTYREKAKALRQLLEAGEKADVANLTPEQRKSMEDELRSWEAARSEAPSELCTSTVDDLIDDSLQARFQRWSPVKQESYLAAHATFQVQSFAIEKVKISETEVRTATAARLVAS